LENKNEESHKVSWWHVSKKSLILISMGLLVIGVIQYQNLKLEEENFELYKVIKESRIDFRDKVTKCRISLKEALTGLKNQKSAN
jgi:hypothetical protein